MKSRPKFVARATNQLPESLITAIVTLLAVARLSPVGAQQPVCTQVNTSGDERQRDPSCLPGQSAPGGHTTAGNGGYSEAEAATTIAKSSSAIGADRHKQSQPPKPCGLYLAESSIYEGVLGVYSGIDRYAKSKIGSDEDLYVPIMDANQNEWSLLHDILWNADIEDDLMLQNYYKTQSFAPGIANLVSCAPIEELSNVQLQSGGRTSISFGVQRNDHPTAGSFSYRTRGPLVASYDIKAGNELFIDCRDSERTTFAATTKGDNEDHDEDDEGEDLLQGSLKKR